MKLPGKPIHSPHFRVSWRTSGELLTIAAVVALVATSAGSHLRYVEAESIINGRQLAYTRAVVHDRLTGSVLDVERFGVESTVATPTERTLLWILDLDRCHGCFDDVSQWIALEQLERHNLWLVLVGSLTTVVDARLRALSQTRVRQVPRDSVIAAVGATLANTKMLLDNDGVVLLVDSRASGQDCGWNFEAQVGALSGLETARRIR